MEGNGSEDNAKQYVRCLCSLLTGSAFGSLRTYIWDSRLALSTKGALVLYICAIVLF